MELAADPAAATDESLTGRSETAAGDAAGAFIAHAALRNATAAGGDISGIVAASAVIIVVKTRAHRPTRLILAPSVFDDDVLVVDAAFGFDPVAAVAAAVHERRCERR
jgi:hypothetical protein